MKNLFKKHKVFLIIVISVTIAAVTVFSAVNIAKRVIYPLKYENAVADAAEKYDLDKSLIYAVIKNESNFKENALSRTQAIGLMQIMPDTYVWLKQFDDTLANNYSADVNDLYDPEINIMFGSCYLRFLIDRFKNTETATAAYNAGPGNVLKWLKDPTFSKDGITLLYIPYGETREYVKKVNKAKDIKTYTLQIKQYTVILYKILII